MLCSRIQLRWSDFMGEICKNRYRHLCGLFQVCRPFMFSSNEKYTIFWSGIFIQHTKRKIIFIRQSRCYVVEKKPSNPAANIIYRRVTRKATNRVIIIKRITAITVDANRMRNKLWRKLEMEDLQCSSICD